MLMGPISKMGGWVQIDTALMNLITKWLQIN